MWGYKEISFNNSRGKEYKKITNILIVFIELLYTIFHFFSSNILHNFGYECGF